MSEGKAKATKADVVNRIAADRGLSKAEAQRYLEATLGAIEGLLSEGSSITIVGFGSFRNVTQNARTVKSPQTGEDIAVPAKQVVRFKPGTSLAESVNGGA